MTGLDGSLALLAMIPAALNPALSVDGDTLSSIVCGSGIAVTIPLGPPKLPGTIPSACCAKGCHNTRRNCRGAVKISR